MENRELLSRIIADPDDDQPRLVYADWLDDHGHAEHAEHVRLCCQPGSRPGNPTREDSWFELWGQLHARAAGVEHP